MDYYSVLGVDKNADDATIKKAFKRLAMKHHPDKGGNEEEFKKVNEAYATLSDPQKRAEYDNPHAGGFGFSHGAQGFDFNDIFRGDNPFGSHFEHIFGQRGHQPRQQIFRTPFSVSLRQAYTGGRQQIQLDTNHGKKIIDLTIPKGVRTGQQIRYDGTMGPGSVLVIDFHVTQDSFFERKGDHLYSKHNISVLDLIVGHKFKFTTISGSTLEVKVKERTPPNTQIKLPGYGMPTMHGSYGDQFILLNPILPVTIESEIVDSIKKYKEIQNLKDTK